MLQARSIDANQGLPTTQITLVDQPELRPSNRLWPQATVHIGIRPDSANQPAATSPESATGDPIIDETAIRDAVFSVFGDQVEGELTVVIRVLEARPGL